MKIKRYKKVNKHLQFYCNNYGFRQPYQILIDGTFCFAALNNQINIADNIPRYFQSEIKLVTTQCNLIEMDSLGVKVSGATKVLKQYPIHKCGHEGKPIPAAKCLISMIKNNNLSHYIVATNDRDLQEQIRKFPGIPLLYLHLKTPVLDPPTHGSVQYAQNKTSNQIKIDQEKLKKLKEKHGIVEEEDLKPRKKKKNGPNPLSCKKKKKKTQIVENPIKKKKDSLNANNGRKKLRIPAHVKEVFLKELHKK